jgi:hypothetical protein
MNKCFTGASRCVTGATAGIGSGEWMPVERLGGLFCRDSSVLNARAHRIGSFVAIVDAKRSADAYHC